MSVYKYGRTVAEFVFNYRVRNDLSQGELGHRLNFHSQYISNVERGVHKAPKTFCIKMSKVLGAEEWKHLVGLMTDEWSDKISSFANERRKQKVIRRRDGR